MRNITAETVFSYMAPSTLVDFIMNLPDDSTRITTELREIAYRKLIINAGQQDADNMLAEYKPN